MSKFQIVAHDNWFRDFVWDMSRRGPKHTRSIPENCPENNADNVFVWGKGYHADKDHYQTLENTDQSQPFTFLISIDGCDESTLHDLMYYGREMLNQNLVRPPISEEAKEILNTNPMASLIIENSAEGHASQSFFNTLLVLVSFMGLAF